MTIPIPPKWPTNASLAVSTGANIDATIKAAAEYHFGAHRRALNLLEQVVIASLSRTDQESLQNRSELAVKLANMLTSDIAPETKSFFCKQAVSQPRLQRVGQPPG